MISGQSINPEDLERRNKMGLFFPFPFRLSGPKTLNMLASAPTKVFSLSPHLSQSAHLKCPPQRLAQQRERVRERQKTSFQLTNKTHNSSKLQAHTHTHSYTHTQKKEACKTSNVFRVVLCKCTQFLHEMICCFLHEGKKKRSSAKCNRFIRQNLNLKGKKL